MKNIICGLVLLGAVSAFADDSYLYWMVGDGAPDYAYARVRDQNGTYLNIYDSGFDYQYTEATGDKSGVSKGTVNDFKSYGEGFYAQLGSSSSSFFVELYNSSDKFVAQSGPLAYSLAAIYSGGMATPPSTPSSFSSFAIPEPSSGLLMLVGCAVLGLRRRKQKNA